MDRKALAKFTHDSGHLLTVENPDYKQWVFRYTFLELEKDLGVNGDVSSNLLFSTGKYDAKAKIVAKSAGVLAGIAELRYFLLDSSANFRPRLKGDFDVTFNFSDGDMVSVGDDILTISADIRNILAVERLVLNLLMRMSAVATFTRRLIELTSGTNVLLAPTRKTLWGLLDKRAVSIGGGATHRLNLSDSVIIKDTHFDIFNRNFEDLFKKIGETEIETRFIELEVLSADEALLAAEGFHNLAKGGELHSIGVLMFDNMATAEIVEAIKLIKERGVYDSVLLEASGGINEENLASYAKTGVDVISMGCLTGGVPGFDLSMKVL